MQRRTCAAGAVISIGHARAESVDVLRHISVDFPVAFDMGFTYCGQTGTSVMAGESSCRTLPTQDTGRPAAEQTCTRLDAMQQES